MKNPDLGAALDLCQFCPITWQGEGPNTGRLVTLVRFKKCNLNCSFCDTKALMTAPPISLRFVDLMRAVLKTGCLLITGGEPLGVKVNAEATVRMATALKAANALYHRGFSIEIETNAISCPVQELRDLIELKIPLFISCGIKWPTRDGDKAIHLAQDIKAFLQVLKEAGVHENPLVKVAFKLLWPEPAAAGLIFPETVQRVLAEDKDNLIKSVWMMPLGHTKELVLTNAPAALEIARMFGFGFSPRLHILHDFD